MKSILKRNSSSAGEARAILENTVIYFELIIWAFILFWFRYHQSPSSKWRKTL